MDPIANLVEQLLLVQRIQDIEDGKVIVESPLEVEAVGIELATLVRAMHDWRYTGGRDPYDSVASWNEVERLAKLRGWRG